MTYASCLASEGMPPPDALKADLALSLGDLALSNCAAADSEARLGGVLVGGEKQEVDRRREARQEHERDEAEPVAENAPPRLGRAGP